MSKIMTIKRIRLAGFGILEVLVSMLIITMGLVGVLSLVLQNINAQYINRNVLIASELAQEGVELTRNIRDSNWLSAGNSWEQDLVNGSSRQFIIDYRGRSSLADVANISDSAANLKIDTNSFYWHGAGTASVFNRIINTTDIIAGGENYLNVTCTVQWRERNQYHDYVVSTLLYNWR